MFSKGKGQQYLVHVPTGEGGALGHRWNISRGFGFPRVLPLLLPGQAGYFIARCEPSYLPSSVFLSWLSKPSICFRCPNAITGVPVQKREFMRIECRPLGSSAHTDFSYCPAKHKHMAPRTKQRKQKQPHSTPVLLTCQGTLSCPHIEGIKVLASKWHALLPGDTIRVPLDYKLELLFGHFELWIQVWAGKDFPSWQW